MSYELEPENQQSHQPNRPRHPLDVPPPTQQPPPSQDDAPQMPRIRLNIPSVKPRVIWGLIAINVAIFLAAFYVMETKDLINFYNWGANDRYAVRNSGEYYRLFSSMFLHGSEAHIFFNMYALYIIGQTVERFFGYTRFILIYFLGGLLGSVLSVLFNDGGSSVGASGAVFAIFGAEMIFLYRHRKLLGKVADAQLRQLVIIAVINFAIGAATQVGNTQVQIDNWGHIGGMAGGLILAWLIGPVLQPKLHPDQIGVAFVEDRNPLNKNMILVMIYVIGIAALLATGINT